ncbi:spore germination protein GerPC [Sutcliffiella horikoshii]|uniref:spore germination protein GerPC n=1 Tax=Sutcliffiella horikoshii TaxID=79883 RepID=UPI001CFCD4E7|nr:spore germination protein GerPC [Sutcliffiella horikoshii]
MSTNDEMKIRLQDLESKIDQLTVLFNKINDTRQQVVHYHIKTLEIKNAQIDKLDYHLDSIGIEQLSGTLNIGNNFDAKQTTPIDNPTLKNDKDQVKKVRPAYRPLKKKTNESKEGQHISVSNRKKGFSVSIRAKEES